MAALLHAALFVAPKAVTTFTVNSKALPHGKWLAEAYASTDVECLHLPPEEKDFKVVCVTPSPTREALTEDQVHQISYTGGFPDTVQIASEALSQVLKEVAKGPKMTALATAVFELSKVSLVPSQATPEQFRSTVALLSLPLQPLLYLTLLPPQDLAFETFQILCSSHAQDITFTVPQVALLGLPLPAEPAKLRVEAAKIEFPQGMVCTAWKPFKEMEITLVSEARPAYDLHLQARWRIRKPGLPH